VADIALLVNGKKFEGWQDARVTRGIESIAGGFELSVSDRWRSGIAPWPILPEDECTLLLGGSIVVTGYIDSRRAAYSATSHDLSVSGRDKTGALVDCSAVLKTWEYVGISVLDIAKRLAGPFSIPVSLNAAGSVPVPTKVSVDPGDTPFDAIERACRLAGLLPVADGKGGLVLMRPGNKRAMTELVEGENIISASGTFDASSRYRRYVVLGQHGGSDELFGPAASAVTASAQDSGVRRANRVMIVRPEGNVSTAQAQRRAEWEATVRAARADAVTVTVQGWTQADGSLWPINALARLRSPRLGVDGDLLISQTVFAAGAGGTTTELTLRRPDAFKPEPVLQPEGGWREIARGV
jgi:prophage tail gpP-like protein